MNGSTAKPLEIIAELADKAAEPKAEITKPRMAKLRRAFRKAGRLDVEADLILFARELLDLGVPVMRRSSGRIARALRNEITVASLKEEARKPLSGKGAPFSF